MAVTLQQVASLAGVSLATASRVLNRSARHPRADITARVQEAATRLGYVPNAQAQALARATTGLVGLVVHDIDDPYFGTIAAGVQSVARAGGRQTLLACTNRDPELECDAIASFAAHRTEAVIIAGSRRSGRSAAQERLMALCAAYEQNGGRVALVGQPMGGFCGGRAPEPARGAGPGSRSSWRLGHRRFVVVAGPRWLRTSVDRAAAFEDDCSRPRDDSDAIEVLPRCTHGLHAETGPTKPPRELIGSGAATGRPLCILAVSDVMALGVLAACRDLGVAVPAQVAVAGFDDIVTLRDVAPSLTTVRLDLHAMGSEAARLALTPSEPVRTVFPATVVLRESTRIEPPA